MILITLKDIILLIWVTLVVIIGILYNIYAKKSGKCIFEINISHPDIWLLNNLLRIKEDSINPNMIYKEV